MVYFEKDDAIKKRKKSYESQMVQNTMKNLLNLTGFIYFFVSG